MICGHDQFSVRSIGKVGRLELKKKLFGALILSGGCGCIGGLAEILEERVQSKIHPEDAEKVEVVRNIKETDPRCLSWRGGAILSQLETSKDMWITRFEWMDSGTRLLKERCAFVW